MDEEDRGRKANPRSAANWPHLKRRWHKKNDTLTNVTTYTLFNIGRIGIIRLTVNKAHDVAGSLVRYLKIVRLFRKHPGLLGTVDHCTTDWTRLMTVLPAHSNNSIISGGHS